MARKSIRRIMIIWIVLLAVAAMLGRTSIAADNGRTSADFLNIGAGARGAALGNAFTSVADDGSAIYWNPAGIIREDKAQLSFSHFAWLQDISYDFLGASYPVSNRVSLGIGAQYLDYGRIEGYDADDNPTGEIGSTFDFAGSLSAAYRISDEISIGASGKIILISLADTRASAMAADFGFRYSGEKFAAGLAIFNIGGKLKFDQDQNDLPTNIRGGISIRPFGSALLASIEAERALAGTLTFRNGLEYNFDNRYFLRTGYEYSPDQIARGLSQGISFGVGAVLGPSQIDYAFTPSSSFGSDSIHRFSLSLKIGK